MTIIENSSRRKFALPGLEHQTLASGADQLKHLEMWIQTMAPGGETPIHYHECEQVIVVLKGSGRLTMAEQTSDFGPGTTLVILPKVIHHMINTGTDEMIVIIGSSETPARVFTPDGTPMAPPWSHV
jgi:quercetin dioxygenase-like cupin family protein